ncbi:hypothetical protein Cni_G09527 [Canna indica]|uniref:Uncharacterized protein n=1 Tax=Canna indica TaxID=4628 RepID=A0AAQ3K464_9LILI|nr:hypothetical protein Cni_G09527 [Canna indica]
MSQVWASLAKPISLVPKPKEPPDPPDWRDLNQIHGAGTTSSSVLPMRRQFDEGGKKVCRGGNEMMMNTRSTPTSWAGLFKMARDEETWRNSKELTEKIDRI